MFAAARPLRQKREITKTRAGGDMDVNRLIERQTSIIAQKMGCLPTGRLLDLGCGNGSIVHGYRERGVEAYGCDLTFKEGPYVAELARRGVIRLVDPADYVLPYPDAYFNVVVTNQVMEHVQDYGSTLREIWRVLVPGGICLSIFPPKFRLLEAHVNVPLGGAIQASWWLTLWAALGMRSPGQDGLDFREVATKNQVYLRQHTNYLSAGEIRRHFDQVFSRCWFCEREFLNSKNRQSKVGVYLFSLPLTHRLYGAFWMRAILAKK